jgi:glutathione synthase/RimK-type ligase-like ATP-grasp enzyme
VPPSNKQGAEAFIKAGKDLGIEVDPVTRNDYARLAEYDALFIRETTALNHHTFRFAKRAENEGMVVIDDPSSILRCTNKLFLWDLLKTARCAHPAHRAMLYRSRSEVAGRTGRGARLPGGGEDPDGAFSKGIELKPRT